MVSPFGECEKCAIIRCDKTRWICNVVRKWVENQWNVAMVGWTNNQVPTLGPTQDQDQRCVHVVSKGVVSKGAFIRNVKNPYFCKWSIKEIYKWRCDYTTILSKGETWKQTTLGSKDRISHQSERKKPNSKVCDMGL